MPQSTWIGVNRRVIRIAFALLAVIWGTSAGLLLLGKWAIHAHLISGLSADLELKDVVLFLVVGSVASAFAVANYIWQTDLQRGSLLRELTTKFFTDPTLYGAYSDLVYNYEAAAYREVANAIEAEVVLYGGALKQPIFYGSEPWQHGVSGPLEPGKRRFHPFFFQGSPEEARLDTVLSYLDLIAYHIKQGHLSAEEVRGGLGEIFSVVANKPFITEYMLYISGEVDLAGTTPAPPPTGAVPPSVATDVRGLYDNKLYQTLEEQLVPYRRTGAENYQRHAIKEALRKRDVGRNLFIFSN